MSAAGDFNRARVFELIHLFEPISRAEIASQLDLTSAAVSNIVAELLDRGYIEQLGRRHTNRGQPAIELGVKAAAAYTVGLHFEPGSVEGIVSDLKGTVLKRERSVLSPMPSPTIVLENLIRVGDSLIKHVDSDKLIGLGLATAGPIDQLTGSVSNTEYTSDWGEVPLREPLSQAFDLPVFMDNNATAGAIGEYWYGVGRSYANFLFVGFGSLGLGGGLVLNKRVYRGSALNAAEFGHMLVGRQFANDGLPPFLEQHVSGHALRRDLGDTILEDFEHRLNHEDSTLIEWLDTASEIFSDALVSVDNLLDLDTIIVGGQLHRSFFGALLERVERKRASRYMRGWSCRSTVQLGQLGRDSAVMGAATLPMYDAFSPDVRAGNKANKHFTSTTGGPMH